MIGHSLDAPPQMQKGSAYGRSIYGNFFFMMPLDPLFFSFIIGRRCVYGHKGVLYVIHSPCRKIAHEESDD